MVHAIHILWLSLASLLAATWICAAASAQEKEPGDEMIGAYLKAKADELHARFADDLRSPQEWQERLPQLREEYLYMLGLWPLPEKTPLEATVTGEIPGDGFVVEKLHYQSRPKLYVTANLYRPAKIAKDEKLPAVLYVCGHSSRGRSGNKAAFQSHGAWFARHGYICLVVDTLQLGEIGATHHGTYREQRWWWHSRGYTPAGVECWNGVRGIDYLISRGDVDPSRIAVTGISGGGAATFWIAAADERVAAAAPVSGMADLPSYVTNRVINGHCDCMFLYNTFQWPWARIAALVAPRPLLFVNSDNDPIFPMDANDRISNSLERLYSLYGAGDRIGAVVSIGGHAYRQDIRQATFRFVNTWLKNDPRLVNDSEELLIGGVNEDGEHPLPPESLRVFATDEDLPQDELNTSIDRHFVPMAQVAPPGAGEFAAWKAKLLEELGRVSLRGMPSEIPPATEGEPFPNGAKRLATEPGIEVILHDVAVKEEPRRIVLIADSDYRGEYPHWADDATRETAVYAIEPRGTASFPWTRNNPPNYVERSHALLGLTVDAGRIWDIAASAGYLKNRYPNALLVVAGKGADAVLGAYAALVQPAIDGAILHRPLESHMAEGAPQLLNVLRVCDVPQVIGMLAPLPVTLKNAPESLVAIVRETYAAAGAEEKLEVE